MDIQLNFINQSNDANNSQIVIFQKNVAGGVEHPAVAWRVIENCGRGDYHPFVYPISAGITSMDRWGNFTPMLDAREGQLFEVKREETGDALVLAGPASNPMEIQVVNALPDGVIGAHLYRGEQLIASQANLAPGRRAAFQFKPTLWIGVVSEVSQGEDLNAATLSQINTELSLLGIASADIVMTGGGPGGESTPFEFSLQNVRTA